MKRLLIIAALAAVAWPATSQAQVEKQVEVTKAYVPTVESAVKLAVAPDMTDTTRMRPEIDYTITPLSLETGMQTPTIQPAKVTYWEFNRPQPFYLKIGGGYPLNSLLDFYAATQNPGTGYLLGYVNHEGRFGELRNDLGVARDALRMFNGAGIAAGKYLGRHTLEAALSYDNRMYTRFGSWILDKLYYSGAGLLPAASAAPGDPAEFADPAMRLDYGDARIAVRLGDNFKDLSRTNFEVELRGGLFNDLTKANPGLRELSAGAGGRIARGFGSHRVALHAGYDRSVERLTAAGDPLECTRQQIEAGLRYGYDGGLVRLELGADYVFDRTGDDASRHRIFPFARFDFNLGASGFRPFVEADGGVRMNDPRTMARMNPYLASVGGTATPSTAEWNGRIGFGGGTGNGVMNYRIYAGYTQRSDACYWAAAGFDGPELCGFLGSYLPFVADQRVVSFNGEAACRPVSTLVFSLGLHGYIYNDDAPLATGLPAFEGDFGVRYDGRKVAFGAEVRLQSAREWSMLLSDGSFASEPLRAPFGADVRARFEWKISHRVSFFAEGRNLANRRLCEIGGYPEYGAHFIAGFKLNF